MKILKQLFAMLLFASVAFSNGMEKEKNQNSLNEQQKQFVCAFENYMYPLDEPDKEKEKARRKENKKIIKKLLENKLDTHFRMLGGEVDWQLSPIQAAAEISYYLPILKLLLKYKPEVTTHIPGTSFSTPLLLACEFRNDKAADLLLEYDKSVVNKTNDRSPIIPLHHAAMEGNIKLVTALIKNGSDINSNSGWGTPLLGSIGNLPMVELLIKEGANVNIGYIDNKNTPLHVVAGTQYQHTGLIINALLEAGAGIDIENAAKETALDVAIKNGCLQNIKQLLSWCCQKNSLSNEFIKKSLLLLKTYRQMYTSLEFHQVTKWLTNGIAKA